MTFDAALVAATMILSTTVFIMIVVVSRRRLAAKEEELRQQASMRGWTFQRARDGAVRVRRWSGTTDGVAWIAESLEGSQGGTHHRGGTRTGTVTRWRTAPDWMAPRGALPAAPIVLMGVPEGKGPPMPAAPEGEGWAVKLAQKAVGFAFDKMIDIFFGKEPGADVDAGAMKRVTDDSIPGYVVMAADPDAATRLLFQGLGSALKSAAANSSSLLSDTNRPWILLWPKGIVLARMEKAASTEQVERLMRAGVALVRALPRSG